MIYVILAFLMSCDPAYAYLDPGTGTFLIQIIATMFVFFAAFARRIGAIFSKIFSLKKFFSSKD